MAKTTIMVTRVSVNGDALGDVVIPISRIVEVHDQNEEWPVKLYLRKPKGELWVSDTIDKIRDAMEAAALPPY